MKKLIALAAALFCAAAMFTPKLSYGFGAAMPDKTASVADQVAHGKLAMEPVDAKALDLTADDIAFLKSQIGKLGYNAIAVYQAVKLLDPAADK